MSYRQKLLKFKIIQFFSSLKLMLSCLFLLYLLTLCGTIAQVQEGLYLAQQRYFESFFFLAFGFFPFPGAQLVMWFLFLNLVCVALTRFMYQWQRSGIILIHCGLLIFLISGYITLHSAKESHLTLSEGQASNVSVAYHDWELAVWQKVGEENPNQFTRDITALDMNMVKRNQTFSFEGGEFQLNIKEFFRNCEAFTGAKTDEILNASNIVRLEKAPLHKEPERNTPGGAFTITAKEGQTFELLLFGGENQPLSLDIGKKKYSFILRNKRYPLPFILRLKDFKKEDHPGTQTARSFQSLVEIQVDKAWRSKLISMNDPLRFKDFTFYQASFTSDKMGNQTSTLAVVKNVGRVMPYISTFVTFTGLLVHFSMMALRSRQSKKKAMKHDG